MAGVDDLDGVLEQFKQAGQEFVKGNPKPVQELFSHRDDVSLANPFGPPARGWEQVAEAQRRGASVFRDGEIYDFETVAKYVTDELACILWIERTNANVGGSEDVTPCDLRVTITLRPEEGTWKVRASARGPHNLRASCRVGDTGLAHPIANFLELRLAVVQLPRIHLPKLFGKSG